MELQILTNILNQSHSLEKVARYQFDQGRPDMEAAATAVLRAKRVLLSGMGGSLFACIPLSYRLAEAGIQAQVIEASELLYYAHHICDKDTVVVLVSRSGETVEAIKLLPLLKQNGVVVIGVTNTPESTVAIQATRTILVNSDLDRLVALQTYTGTVLTLLMLGATITGALDAGWRERFQSFVPQLEELAKSCVNERGQLDQFIDAPRAIYLMGRGPSNASVHASALLFHETAKQPAVPMSSAHFRHGSVEGVDDNFRAIVFATNPVTRKLDLAVADDVARLGGQAKIVGAGSGETTYPFRDWPVGLPADFAQIAEIIPIQCATVRLAELKGFVPGDFRYCTVVTTTEQGF
jgi:glutamine---fructose-6-phosphate transaminase (isomerizing)